MLAPKHRLGSHALKALALIRQAGKPRLAAMTGLLSTAIDRLSKIFTPHFRHAAA